MEPSAKYQVGVSGVSGSVGAKMNCCSSAAAATPKTDGIRAVTSSTSSAMTVIPEVLCMMILILGFEPSEHLAMLNGFQVLKRTAESLIVTLDVNHATRYAFHMIVSFKSTDTEALASGQGVNRFVNIESVARRKLRQLQVAATIKDLSVPPENRLEALSGDREGQYSIRVNDQYRVCFRWTAAGAEDVEIVDYH